MSNKKQIKSNFLYSFKKDNDIKRLTKIEDLENAISNLKSLNETAYEDKDYDPAFVEKEVEAFEELIIEFEARIAKRTK